MKIAFLSYYSGNVNRGVETFVSELSSRLRKYHEVEVYSSRNSNDSIKSFTLNTLRTMDRQIDLIIPTNGRWQSFLCRLWAIKNHKKMIISGQSGIGFDDRLNLYMFPDVFVGMTDFQVSWAKKINPFVRVEKIPNGVDLAKFNPEGKKIDIRLPGKKVLVVSALTKDKRLDLVIRAVSLLKDVSLVIVGKGECHEELENMGRELLPGRIRIMALPFGEMPNIYRSVDLFTFATVPWESFGIVLVEAMASGLGVVSSLDPIRKEIVGEAGILVDPTNIKEYSLALEKALEKNWGSAPRDQAEKFSWDYVASGYEKLIRSL